MYVNTHIISVPGSCFYLTTYEACKSKLSKYMLKETVDGKPPSLLAQAPLIVTAALGAEGELTFVLCDVQARLRLS
jgi:hypothetical protein